MSSKTSYLKIVNESMEGLTVFISQVDSYDWEGQDRPDSNFNNVWIGIDQSVEKKEVMNSHANSAWLRITFQFVSGQRITFRIDQRDAITSKSTDTKEIKIDSDGYYKYSYMNYVVNQKIEKSNSTYIITVKSAKFKDNYTEWMASVSGNRLISDFSIPGTFNSMAYKNDAYMYKCQGMDIESQLNAGVRYFDFDAIARKQGIYVSYGPFGEIVSKPVDFRNTMELFKKFLKSHCTETIIISIHEVDDDNKFFTKSVFNFLEDYHNYVYRNTEVPRLDDVRGRVVIVRRFYCGLPYGINMYDGWPISGVSYFKYKALNNQEYQFSVQNDYYPSSYEQKYIEIYKEMSLAKDNNWFFVNVSGISPYSAGNDFTEYANYINDRIAKDINKLGGSRNYGSLLLVYPPVSLIKQIAKTAIELKQR